MDNGEIYYRRFLSGDKDGLSELVRMYRDGLTIYINSIVNDVVIAEELMEDTFVKLYVNKPKYNGKSSFKTWLYAIGRNTAIDYMRKKSKIVEVSVDETNNTDSESDLEKSYIRNEQKIMLHKIIQSLKEEYSQVLYLIYFEDFSITEAAKIMNKNNKQISDLLYNAKKALKDELERKGFQYEEL